MRERGRRGVTRACAKRPSGEKRASKRESALDLVGAVMAEADEDWSVRRCMATMDALEIPLPPEPPIDDETRSRAERLVLVAMEAAGMGPKAA